MTLIDDQVNRLYTLGSQWEKWVIKSHSEWRKDDERLTEVDPEGADTPRILFVCPEWFENQHYYNLFLELCHQRKVCRIVIDEGHHAMKPTRTAYSAVFQLREFFENIPFTIASASLKETEIRDLIRSLGERAIGRCIRVTTNPDRPNLHYAVHHVPFYKPRYRVLFIAKYARDHAGKAGMVFVRTRKQAETVAKQLKEEGIKADCYHSERRHQLSSILRRFYLNKIQVIVCTSAFSEGVDKPDVRFIFHYSLPPSMTTYFQETGRAGRDKEPSSCILFYSFSGISTIANVMGTTVKGVRKFSKEDREELHKVLEFCHDTTACRRKHILQPFEREDMMSRNTKTDLLLNRLREPIPHSSNLSQCCDLCSMHISPRHRFKRITKEQAKGLEDALQSSQVSIPLLDLSNRVTKHFDSPNEARETIEFLIAVGALKLMYKPKLVREDTRRADTRIYFSLAISAGYIAKVEGLFRPLPVPYSGFDTTKLRSVHPRPYVQVDEATESEEEYSEDDCAEIIVPSRMKVHYTAPSGPDPKVQTQRTHVESAHSPEGTHTPLESDFQTFQERYQKYCKRQERLERGYLAAVPEQVLRRICKKRHNFLNDIYLFAEELEKAGASDQDVEVLMSHYAALERDVLQGRFDVSKVTRR
ncbi:P-loop containing nucleoside triphosphate hydrolase protein [Serendipita vermifera]|nr:P-loop containing nucleoside triphosphate hydrolase protein [Serendipita vermifera]